VSPTLLALADVVIEARQALALDRAHSHSPIASELTMLLKGKA